MISGRLRTKVTIQTYTPVTATNGETTKTWATFKSGVYAGIKTVSGREYLQSDRVQGHVTHEIRIRYISSVLDKMRITDGTRTFQIVTILPDRTFKRYIDIFANQLQD